MWAIAGSGQLSRACVLSRRAGFLSRSRPVDEAKLGGQFVPISNSPIFKQGGMHMGGNNYVHFKLAAIA